MKQFLFPLAGMGFGWEYARSVGIPDKVILTDFSF